MNSVILVLLAFAGYILAYRTYGKYIAKKIFEIKDTEDVPSHQLRDGVDFVPTKKNILFGHHFTTIAGLGPIVGPAIGIIWGWLPAFIWVFFGSIFMGAFHDFASLVISSRHQGKTMAELTKDLISPSTKYVFQFIIQFLLFIVLAVFAMIVGILFNMYPEAVIPVWMQIPIAIWLGRMIKKGKNDFVYSIIAVTLMYATILLGVKFPVDLVAMFAFVSSDNVVTIWAIILFIYVFFASTLPVDTLLQPRDYINSHQLFIAMFLLIVGIFVAHPVISAPAINPAAFAPGSDVPSLAPLIFITIACGAVSGFHALASSGTTVKQVNNEKDTLFIGYGGMIWESFLAVLVILAIAGGLGMGITDNGITYTGHEAFLHHYASWLSASGLNAKLGAFIIGGSNLLASYGIPPVIGSSMIAVFIVSFANTTLDSSARIQRLSVQELFKKKNGETIKPFNNRYVATFFVLLVAAALTFYEPGAKGALVLWPMFGSLNQLLAAIALGIITIYLFQKNKNILLGFIPMLFVLVMTIWAIIENIVGFMNDGKILLSTLSFIILGLTIWLLISGISSMVSFRKITEPKSLINQ